MLSVAILSMRTFLRRMTRLCLGFSKKLEKFKSGGRAVLRAVQLRPCSRNVERYACNGSEKQRLKKSYIFDLSGGALRSLQSDGLAGSFACPAAKQTETRAIVTNTSSEGCERVLINLGRWGDRVHAILATSCVQMRTWRFHLQ